MATKNIGGSINLEGANKYNSDLKQIKSNLAELRSEMKLANAVNKENANSIQALTQKDEILMKQYDQMSKKVDIYSKMFDDAKKKQDEAAKNIDKYTKELEEAKSALEGMEKSGKATDAELTSQKQIVSDLEKKLDGSQKAYDAAGKKMNQYKSATNNTQVELVQLDGELKKNEKYLEEAKNSTDGTAHSIDNLGRETSETKDQISVFGDVLKANLATEAILQGVKMLATGLKTVAKSAYDAGSNFDAAMSKVGAISGASAEDMAKLEEKAKEMGATTVFSATESAEALNYMAMAGWKTDQMLQGLPGIMNLAAASGESLAATSDIVTDALTAFGLSAEDSGHFADVLAQASSNANTNVGMMGETFKYAAPVAGALSMSVEDVAVGIGLMANAGIKASQAGTSLRRILLEMGGDIEISSDEIGDLAVKTTNADGTMRSFNDIIVDLRSAFSGLSESEKKANAQAIVGKNAVSGFLAILNASQSDFDKLTASIQNADGAAARMAAQMNDNLKGDVTIMNSALEGLAIAFEDCFDDAARTSVQNATEVIGKLKNDIENGDMGVSLRRMGEAFEELSNRTLDFAMEALPSVIDGLTWLMDNAETVTSLIAGMITAQLATQTVTPIIMACQGAYIALTAAEEGASIAQGILNGVMNANPIGLIVTALGFAVGALTTYSALARDSAESTESLSKSASDLAESLDQSAQKRADDAANMKMEAAMAKTLRSELENLQKKTSLTIDEQIRQKEIVAELNSIMPDLNLTIDEQTGKLDEHSVAVLKDADALMQQYMAQAAQKDLEEISEGLFEAEKKRLEVSKELNESVRELKATEAEWREEVAAGSDQANVLSDRIVVQKQNIDDLEDALRSADETVAKQKDLFEETSSAIQENTGVVEENTAAIEEQASTYTDATGEIVQRTEEQEKALIKFQEAVESTVTGVNPLFGELKSTTEDTLDSITEHLQKNAETSEKFSDALTKAISNANYGASTEYTQLVNNLAEKGPEATSLLEELATEAESNSEKFQSVMTAMKQSVEGQNSVTAATQELVDTLGTHFTTITTTITSSEEEITSALETEGENQKNVIQSTTDEIVTIAADGVTNTAKAVTDNADEVTTATKTAAEDAVRSAETALGMSGGTSSVFQKMGSSTMKSFAEGIQDEKGTVKAALQLVLQTAVDTMDISGLSSRINKALGASLNS